MRIPLRLLLLIALPCLVLVASGCSGRSAAREDRLVFTRDKGIAVLSLKTNGWQQLLEPPTDVTLADPAVSRDGRRIAYTHLLTPIVLPGRNTDLGSDLYVANVDGSNATLVVRHSVRSEQVLSPSWLPDGSGLLFAVQRFESQRIVTTIEKIDLATQARTVLVQDAYQPAVSRDGTRIAFMRTDANYTQSLWTANADGSGERRLAGEEQQLVSFQGARFSPDGGSVYTGAAGRGELLERAAATRLVALAPAAGAGQVRIDLNGLPEDLWRIDLATGALEQIVELKIDWPSLSWTADGTSLFVYGDRGLYLIDPAKHSAKRLGDGEFHGQMDWLSAQ